MPEATAPREGRPTLLKELLRRRYLQPYRLFCEEYDKVARQLDRRFIGTYPSLSQYKRWLGGRVGGLPRSESCLVLEAMFPDQTVAELFEPYIHDDDDLVPEQAETLDIALPVRGQYRAHIDPALIDRLGHWLRSSPKGARGSRSSDEAMAG